MNEVKYEITVSATSLGTISLWNFPSKAIIGGETFTFTSYDAAETIDVFIKLKNMPFLAQPTLRKFTWQEA
jgi:hypothetical protein